MDRSTSAKNRGGHEHRDVARLVTLTSTMTGAPNSESRGLSKLTVRTRSPRMRASALLEVYSVRASSGELEALVREIKSHDYWAGTEPIAEAPGPEVTPDDVRRQLYWLFED